MMPMQVPAAAPASAPADVACMAAYPMLLLLLTSDALALEVVLCFCPATHTMATPMMTTAMDATTGAEKRLRMYSSSTTHTNGMISSLATCSTGRASSCWLAYFAACALQLPTRVVNCRVALVAGFKLASGAAPGGCDCHHAAVAATGAAS